VPLQGDAQESLSLRPGYAADAALAAKSLVGMVANAAVRVPLSLSVRALAGLSRRRITRLPSDLEIIAEVDDMARQSINLEMALDQAWLPPGTKCHRSRVGFIRRAWEKAREAYLKETGIDVLDAIKRHEAWLRSPDNAPELYVERR
jgi:hypothetical protein